MTLAPLIVIAYLLATNLAAFVIFAWDKRCAERGVWRVPERTLLMLAAIGGTPAMIAGQSVLRHKTWKEPFRTQLLGIAVLQMIALVALSVPQLREAVLSALAAR
jgi:uncharacterized membrane protein YsdA (DUF1294 family)